jgi:glycosyltransferase involved in cell wall biosynthesis
VIVAPHGPGQPLPAVERPAEPRHFLYVGDDEPRKDLPGLLTAYAEYRRAAEGAPLDLVLAGAAAHRAGGEGISGEPEPDLRRLAELHAQAAALVHPSLDEGFGLTLAEAMAAGTPVVAVRNRGVEDVFGDAALLVDPAGVAAALGRIAREEDLRGRLAAAGAEAVAGLSWEASARAHEAAYTLALEGS